MKKRAKTIADKAVLNVWHRQVGELSSRNFAHRLAGSQDLVLRLDIFKKLDKHRGCVNTVSFNIDGDILLSGSDDRRIILWDWETGRTKLSFHSGHSNNVFQAKFMPYTDDRSIVTCAADGQVRHAQILERGAVETELLGKHQRRAHKLAIEPGSPHIFYTCGEDGLVQHFDLRMRHATELFTCQPIDDRRNHMPVVPLNAIAIDPRNPNLFAVAGSDEYTRLYDIRMYKCEGSTEFGKPTNHFCPPHLLGDDQVGITGLAFSDQSELLVSYNDEFIYLFTREMGLGPDPDPTNGSSDGSDKGIVDLYPNNTPQVYKGHRNCETVKGVSFFGPRCEYVVSGSDCGRIFIWKKKAGELIRVMEADKQVVNCIEPHPHGSILASSGIENDIKIWTPKAVERATLPVKIEQVLMHGRIKWFAIGDEDEDDDDDDDDDEFFSDDDDGDVDDDEDEDDVDDSDNDDKSDGSGGDEDDIEDDYDYDDDDDDDLDEDVDNFVDGYDDGNDDTDLPFLCSAETEGKGMDVQNSFTRGPDGAAVFAAEAEN